MSVVAVARLNKDGRIGLALCKHFIAIVIKMNTFANVTPRVFDGRVPIDIGQLSKAEPSNSNNSLINIEP